MPQIFQVLRCYKCQTFQVHQVKKCNKWVCKMCSEKQSIKRHYGIGTGLECRVHVQKLNGIRGGIIVDDQDNESLNDSVESDSSDKLNCCNNDKQSKWNYVKYSSECNTKCKDETMHLESSKISPNKSDCYNNKKQSKWNNYIDEEEECVTKDKDETMYLENIEVVLEVPKKKPRKKHNTHNSSESLPDISNSDNNSVSFTNNKFYARKCENNFKLCNQKILLQDNTPNNAFNDKHSHDSVEFYTSDKPSDCNNIKQNKCNNYVKNAKGCFTKCKNETMYLENSKVVRNKSGNYTNKKQSKWNNYIDEDKECITEDKDETMYLENTEVVLEVPIKKRKKKHDSNVYLPNVTNNDNNSVSFTNSKLEDNTPNNVKINNILLKGKQNVQKESKWNMYINKETGDSTCEDELKVPICEQNTATVSTTRNMKVTFSLSEDGDIDEILSI